MVDCFKAFIWLPVLALLAGCAQRGDNGYVDRFAIKPASFASSGSSQFFILEPGYQLVYEGDDDGKAAKLIISVLNETKMIDGVETRVVEERESLDGAVIEVSRNYFAIDRSTGDVYYFGEDVDTFKDGKLSGHPGVWHSGVGGAHYGLFVPRDPKIGQKFYQEIAPQVAMDRVEIASTSETVTVPAGRFQNCIRTNETTPLEPGNVEHKLYAPKVGLIVDGDLKLVRHGMQSTK